MDTIESLIREFAGRIERVAAKACADRMIVSIVRGKATTKNGHKKGPIQLCPVPGCRERAAPVYGMVCAKHKDTPKKVIAKYREARRQKAK
jgi:hypothetical protein